jgi:hypothetical protein
VPHERAQALPQVEQTGSLRSTDSSLEPELTGFPSAHVVPPRCAEHIELSVFTLEQRCLALVLPPPPLRPGMIWKVQGSKAVGDSEQ